MASSTTHFLVAVSVTFVLTTVSLASAQEKSCFPPDCQSSYFDAGLVLKPNEACYTDGSAVELSCRDIPRGYLGLYTCRNGSWNKPSPSCEASDDPAAIHDAAAAIVKRQVIDPDDIAREVEVHCGSRTFQVDIPRTLLEETYKTTNIHLLGDSSCTGFENDDYISVNSSLTGCGTNYEENTSNHYYMNTIVNDEADPDAIVEYHHLNMQFTCQYKRSKILKTHFRTVSEGQAITLSGTGRFIYDFAIYTDISYSTRWGQPVKSQLGSPLFFRAQLVRSATNLEIHLRSCRATPTPNVDDPVKYEFIRDGCGVNHADVRIFEPNEPRQADFELLSFRFKEAVRGANTQLWIHCEVLNCEVSDDTSECQQGCEEQRRSRSRRAALKGFGGETERITVGPILIEEEKVQKEQDQGDVIKNPWVSLGRMNVAAFTFAGLVVIVVSISLVRATRKPSKRECKVSAIEIEGNY